MPQPESAAAPELSGLYREVCDLQRRLARIERRLEMEAGEPAAPPAAIAARSPAGDAAPTAAIETASVIPLAGRALLGLAGAYLLRALTESAYLSVQAGVAVGLLYALGWLVWAARTPAERRLETALHSLTAALVLAPLLWEATLRFHAVTTWTAGGILLFFTTFGLAVSWRKNLLIVATIATLTGLGTAGALLMATHDVLPFTFVFLAIAAAVEASACLEHWLSERWLAAAAADLSVLLATWLLTNPRGLPESYAPIPQGWLLAAQAALLAIYLASIMVRTLLRGFTFTGFETAQCAAALLIGVGGGLRLSREAPLAAAFSLACAAACYAVAFARLDRPEGRGRNFYTYSSFGFLLALAGTDILFSGAAEAAWLVLSVACIWAGGRFGRLTLQIHGGLYLALALASSGALSQAGTLLLGSDVTNRGLAAVLAGAGAALACYLLAIRYPGSRQGRTVEFLRLALAGALLWQSAAIAAWALTAGYHAWLGADATHAYCATLRTSLLAASALALAWAGSRWRIVELSRLVYPTLALGAYRLVAEDLRQDRKGALFLSLLVYGAALIAAPRLGKSRQAPAA
jgi:hypothetical protein